jgi:D-glycero-D-manno-heptose 1,7-bisphosphate phosphatase
VSPRWDAVFLDRDGTVNVGAPPGEYVVHPESVVLLPGVAAAIARLNRAGSDVIVVTNQRAVALGLLTLGGLDAVNRRLADLLADGGARLDGMYACPHDEGRCACRKPGDGLLRRAFEEHPALRPSRCAIVGDSPRDTAAGTALGLMRVRLSARAVTDPHADVTVADLPAAVDWLLTVARPAGIPR